jgi:hypothetical protein
MATEDNRSVSLEPQKKGAGSQKPDLKDPHFVLSLLEADQVVAAKQGSRFGRKKLSLKMRMILWGLRIYLVIMLVIVAISVVRALHGGH